MKQKTLRDPRCVACRLREQPIDHCAYCRVEEGVGPYTQEVLEPVVMLRAVTLTMEEADKLVERLGFADEVEEHEWNELGHVYTLTDGSALVVRPTVLVALVRMVQGGKVQSV